MGFGSGISLTASLSQKNSDRCQQRIAATSSCLERTNEDNAEQAQSTEWLMPQGSGLELRWWICLSLVRLVRLEPVKRLSMLPFITCKRSSFNLIHVARLNQFSDKCQLLTICFQPRPSILPSAPWEPSCPPCPLTRSSQRLRSSGSPSATSHILTACLRASTDVSRHFLKCEPDKIIV